jgi:hypothetical protein
LGLVFDFLNKIKSLQKKTMNQQTPEWLEDIQNRSWEPEFFVSGGAIFFLLQTNEYLHRQSFLLLQKTGFYEPVAIANLLIATINALIFGFAIHLIIRGVWVSAVTLSYVFPNGIQQDKMHYSPKFKNKIQHIRTTVEAVVRLEILSSLIFSLAFFFAFIILGVMITLLILIPHTSLKETWGETGFQVLQISSRVILGLGVIYAIDFFTLGWVKQQKWFSPIYYPIYMVFSVLTLAPLYRTTYYTLASNIKPWIVVVVGVGYMGLILGFTYSSRSGLDAIYNVRNFLHLNSDEYKFDQRYYDNLRKADEMVEHIAIQSEIVKDKYLKVFIVHQRVIENLIPNQCDMSNEIKKLKCYAAFYRVYIDNVFQKNLKWRQYEHTKTGELGLITFIPIENLSASEHTLKVVLNALSKEHLSRLRSFGMQGATYAVVPFWKE